MLGDYLGTVKQRVVSLGPCPQGDLETVVKDIYVNNYNEYEECYNKAIINI